MGINISTDLANKGKTGITGGTNKGNIESDYQSVTDQAGIYAGKEGFDITVGKNTDLKGAVIASEATADKNKLSTETLTYEDIQNKAEYSASSSGISVNINQQDKQQKDGTTKTETITTPGIEISTPVEGKAESTTKSAIAEGTIEIRGDKNKDISNLSRDTENALNKLDQIFDEKTVKEKQEMVGLFGELAYKAVGDWAESQWEKAKTPEEKAKWAEGGEYKALLHTIVGGIMTEIGGSGFKSGAIGAGVAQALQDQLSSITDPNMRLIASSIVGGIASKIVGGNAQAGASTALSGTKNNDYNHRTHREGEIVHTKDGWFQVIDGVDTAIAEPAGGVLFWEQDTNDGGYGWDYIHGDGVNTRDTYFSGIVKDQYYFVANGQAYGIFITDNTDAEKKIILKECGKEYVEAIIKSRKNSIGDTTPEKILSLDPDNPEEVQGLENSMIQGNLKSTIIKIIKGYFGK